MPNNNGQRIGRDLARLEEKLGYTFNYPQLLLSSVTHPSYCGLETSPYQRLESLGDGTSSLHIEDCGTDLANLDVYIKRYWIS